MKKSIVLLAALSVLVIMTLAISSLFAADPKPNDWRTAEKNCAAANLELAKVRLAIALDQKQEVADSVSQSTIDALEASVNYAQDRLTQLSGGPAADPFKLQLASARQQLKALEADHAKSLEANKLAAGAVSELALRNETALINVAKTRLAAIQSLSKQPVEVRLQWQIGQLQDEIRALWARPLIED